MMIIIIDFVEWADGMYRNVADNKSISLVVECCLQHFMNLWRVILIDQFFVFGRCCFRELSRMGKILLKGFVGFLRDLWDFRGRIKFILIRFLNTLVQCCPNFFVSWHILLINHY